MTFSTNKICPLTQFVLILQFYNTMRSICIALFCTAAVIAIGFASDEPDAVVAENGFFDAPPALADEASLVETLSTSDEVSPQSPQTNRPSGRRPLSLFGSQFVFSLSFFQSPTLRILRPPSARSRQPAAGLPGPTRTAAL